MKINKIKMLWIKIFRIYKLNFLNSINLIIHFFPQTTTTVPSPNQTSAAHFLRKNCSVLKSLWLRTNTRQNIRSDTRIYMMERISEISMRCQQNTEADLYNQELNVNRFTMPSDLIMSFAVPHLIAVYSIIIKEWK